MLFCFRVLFFSRYMLPIKVNNSYLSSISLCLHETAGLISLRKEAIFFVRVIHFLIRFIFIALYLIAFTAYNDAGCMNQGKLADVCKEYFTFTRFIINFILSYRVVVATATTNDQVKLSCNFNILFSFLHSTCLSLEKGD